MVSHRSHDKRNQSFSAWRTINERETRMFTAIAWEKETEGRIEPNFIKECVVKRKRQLRRSSWYNCFIIRRYTRFGEGSPTSSVRTKIEINKEYKFSLMPSAARCAAIYIRVHEDEIFRRESSQNCVAQNNPVAGSARPVRYEIIGAPRSLKIASRCLPLCKRNTIIIEQTLAAPTASGNVNNNIHANR